MYKVLYVDPDLPSRFRTSTMLDWESIGFVLTCCQDPSSAALQFEQDAFSLVIVHMSLKSKGIEICGAIRKLGDVPIILIGGEPDFHTARLALRCKINDYMPDPLCADELRSSVELIKQMLDAAAAHEVKALSKQIEEKPVYVPDSIIDKVKEYVEDSLSQNITLKEISNILHFNCSYLGQKFKTHENMTFNEYLLQQRMEKAKYLLENTDMKVYEVAGEVGYSEMDWFYKKFKAYTGVSANEYRKMISITA